MKIAAACALGLILVVMGLESFRLFKDGNRIEAGLLQTQEKLETAKKDSASLQENLNYFEKYENLEKEMRARFNYRSANEKLFIIVPKDAQPRSSSSSGLNQ